jgi:hypothetical protein
MPSGRRFQAICLTSAVGVVKKQRTCSDINITRSRKDAGNTKGKKEKLSALTPRREPISPNMSVDAALAKWYVST